MSVRTAPCLLRFVGFVVVAGALSAAPTAAGAQARATPRQSMAQEAKVSKDAARITALSRVPGGRMSSMELQRGVAGKLVYVAIITETGKPVRSEVIVDAMTGVVISKRP